MFRPTDCNGGPMQDANVTVGAAASCFTLLTTVTEGLGPLPSNVGDRSAT